MSFICHINNYTEYNEEWNVFSAFNPSKCTHTWSSGKPTVRRPGSSFWGIGALPKGLTSVVDTSCQSRDSNPQPWVTSGFKSNALSIRPQLPKLLQDQSSSRARPGFEPSHTQSENHTPTPTSLTTNCTLTTLHCRKVSFLQCCHMKRYNKKLHVRGVLTSVRYCMILYIEILYSIYIYIYIYIYIVIIQNIIFY